MGGKFVTVFRWKRTRVERKRERVRERKGGTREQIKSENQL